MPDNKVLDIGCSADSITGFLDRRFSRIGLRPRGHRDLYIHDVNDNRVYSSSEQKVVWIGKLLSVAPCLVDSRFFQLGYRLSEFHFHKGLLNAKIKRYIDPPTTSEKSSTEWNGSRGTLSLLSGSEHCSESIGCFR